MVMLSVYDWISTASNKGARIDPWGTFVSIGIVITGVCWYLFHVNYLIIVEFRFINKEKIDSLKKECLKAT